MPCPRCRTALEFHASPPHGVAPPTAGSAVIPAPPSTFRQDSSDRLNGALSASLETGPGSRVGLEAQFDIHDKLGEGGMGAVYRVTDLQLRRDVALKVIRSSVAEDAASGPRATRRFLKEARITGRLEHPAVPPVHAVGALPDGRPFLVMKVLSGVSLDDAIRARTSGDPEARTTRDLIVVLARVCEAVACAHSQGIIHRDLKPDNIQLGELGEVLVLDWGLAKAIDEPELSDKAAPSAADLEESALEEPGRVALTVQQGEEVGLTLHGAVLGTPGYMPPEQAGGEAVDERADVFALGAILTEILTGEPPVEGKTSTNRIVATLKGNIRGPRDIEAGVDAELDSLARAALETEPAERLDSAGEMARELRRWLAGEELRCHRASPLERLMRSVRRRPGRALALSGGLLLLLLVSVLVAGLLAAQRSQAEAEDAEARSKAEAKRFDRTASLLSELTRKAARRGDSAELDQVVHQLLELNKATPEFLLTLASMLRIGGAADSADRLLERAARDFPKAEVRPEILFERILIAFERDDAAIEDRLKEFLAMAKARSLKSPLTLFAEGAMFRDVGQRKTALGYYDQAIESGGGDHPWLVTNRGLLLLELDRLERARVDLERAVELQPSSARVWANLGLYHRKAGEFETALVAFERAIRLQPMDPGHPVRKADVLLSLGRAGQALAATEVALRLDPDHIGALTTAARTLAALKRHKEALELIDRALDRPALRNAARLRDERIVLLENLGRLDEAIADARRFYEEKPGLVVRGLRLGRLLSMTGRSEELLTMARALAEARPRDPRALNLLAVALMRSGDGPGAATIYQRIFELDEGFMDARVGYADLLLSSRQYKAAIKQFTKILQARADHIDALAGRAHGRRRIGDQTGARADLDRIIELAPKSRQAAWARKMRKKIRADEPKGGAGQGTGGS